MQRERKVYSKGYMRMLLLLSLTGMLTEIILVVWGEHNSVWNWIMVASLIVLCMTSAYLYSSCWMQNEVLRRGDEVLGTVVKIHYVYCGEREYAWLECGYRDLFGRRYAFRSQTMKTSREGMDRAQVGDRIPVVYIPKEADKYLVMVGEVGCSSPLQDCA